MTIQLETTYRLSCYPNNIYPHQIMIGVKKPNGEYDERTYPPIHQMMIALAEREALARIWLDSQKFGWQQSDRGSLYVVYEFPRKEIAMMFKLAMA